MPVITQVLANEVQQDGIEVALISLGGVNTKKRQVMCQDINMDELIQPEERAELVESFITRKRKGIIDHF